MSAYSYAGKNVSQELYDYCLGLGDLVQGVTPNGQIYSEVVIKFGSKTISTQNYDDWENMPTIYLAAISTACATTTPSHRAGRCPTWTLKGEQRLRAGRPGGGEPV